MVHKHYDTETDTQRVKSFCQGLRTHKPMVAGYKPSLADSGCLMYNMSHSFSDSHLGLPVTSPGLKLLMEFL